MKAVQHKRILIFNVNWLGDVLFSTAVIRNIRRNFPESFIACIIPSRCYPVLKGNPHLDEIIIFDEKDRHKGLFARLAFIRNLKKKKFDTVFLLHRSFSRALICRLAGIKQRIGHYTKKRAFLLTEKIIPPERDSLHRIDYYLDVIEKAGLRVEDRYLDFYFTAEDEEQADAEVLVDDAARGAGKLDQERDAAEIVVHQRHGGAVDRHVVPRRAHRDADVAGRQRGGVVDAVADEGHGIPAELREHLFEPGRSGRPGGSGLGLAISRLLARQIGATLALDSTGPAGTSFSLTLPLGD